MQRHRFDPVSFVFGVLLSGLAVVGLTDVLMLRVIDLRWLGPALLVLLGLVLVVTAARNPGREEASSSETNADSTDAVEGAADRSG